MPGFRWLEEVEEEEEEENAPALLAKVVRSLRASLGWSGKGRVRRV